MPAQVGILILLTQFIVCLVALGLACMFGAISVHMAKKRGLRIVPAFFAGFFAGFIALFFIAMFPKMPGSM